MTNLIFKNEDFRGLPFHIHKVDSSKSLLKQIPDLAQIAEFVTVEHPDKDKIIRYIILMYSKESPLVKKFTDLVARKKNAAEMAGFDLVKDDTPIPLEPLLDEEEEDDRPEPTSLLYKLYNFADPEIGSMVIGFLRFQNDLAFSMLASNEQTFFEYQQAILSSIEFFKDDKDKMTALNLKTKLMDESDAIAVRIDKYRKQIYIEDKAIDFVKKRSSSPESIAVQ